MTGGGLLGLILVSMGWLLFLGGLATNYCVLRRQLRAKEGEAVPSGMGFIPGVVGSVTVFFTLPALAGLGVHVPWPWLWIALPLFLDPYCLPGLLLLLRK
jgi:hypothetical protein